jgi:hypothetical protein
MKHNEFTTRTELKSLTRLIMCTETKCGRLRMLKVCLDYSSMRLGVPFIAPRQLGAVGGILGRQILPSVGWRTGQSGAPPDNHCSCSLRDFLPFLAQPTVATSGWLAHRTLSGAPSRPLARATCRPRIWRPTVALAFVGSPDSPVNYSRTPLKFSRESSSPETSLAHQTLSGAPPDSLVCQTVLSLGSTHALSSTLFLFMFLALW